MNRRFILPALYILLGAVLITCGTLQVMDSYWSGMGGALLCVGVVRLIQTIRYKTNTQYKEKMDTEVSDERNRFLRAKAWSWTGYLFILIAAVGSIVFKVVNMEREMMLCSYAICLMLILYWVSYFIVRKKY